MHKDLIKLGEAATYINGYAFKPDDRGKVGLPIIRIQDLTGNSYDLGFYDGDYPEKIEINDGDVLISWSASLGVYIWNNGKALLNQHIFKVVFDKVNIDKNYFVYAVRYKLDEMGRKTHGATMKHIVKRDFDATEIPYPSKHEQIEIANNLKRIENIIELRSHELQLLDELIKARFVELFYDKGYPVLKWNDVFVTTTGKLDSNAAVENGEYPFFTCSKKMLKIDNFAFDQEALLLSGNNAAGKYDVKYYKGKFNAYQRTYILGLKNNWSYQLFRYQLESKLVYLQQQSLGGLTKYLTMKILEKLEFVIPPIEKQLEFETFVYRVDKSKLLSLIKLLEQLITYLYNVFIIYRQDKGEEVERYE